MEELLLYWIDVVTKDLRGFADPATAPDVRDDGLTLIAHWTQRGQDREATFELSPNGDFRWLDGAVKLPYPEFLTSERMGDFAQLARAIATSFPLEPNYVPTRAEYEAMDDSGPRRGPSDTLLVQGVEESLDRRTGRTQLAFVKADAGAGKTTLLRQIAARQAERFLAGASPFLFFYVSAQGRALSNLSDAFSGELDDVRAAFTRDAVPVFVRHGVLVPIIDGFDELLGAAGYGDAFGSLQQFIETLDGSGVIVVSARSSFYDVEFVGTGSRSLAQLGAFDLTPVTLDPWSDEEIALYLARSRGNDDASAEQELVMSLDERDRRLLGKPFFARQFAELAGEGITDGALLDYLIDRYLNRESDKIVDRDGQPLLPVDGHRQLFELTAEEMWVSENRRLTSNDLQTLAEMVAEQNSLSGDAARQLTTKVTSYAGFAMSPGSQEFTFEHEVYFDYFLARALSRHIRDASLSTTYLNSGVLPEEIVDLAIGGPQADATMSVLESLATSSGLYDNFRRNAGALYAAAFRQAKTLTSLDVRNASFVNVDFGDVSLNGVTFSDCVFSGTHLERARFKDCVARDCFADAIILSNDSHWGIDGLPPGERITSLVFYSDDGRLDTFVPSEIEAALASIGGPHVMGPSVEYSTRATALLDLLGQFTQLFRRMNIACHDDNTGPARKVFLDPHWVELHALLEEHAIIKNEMRSASGHRRTFYRPLVSLPDLMRFQGEANLPEDSVGDFWRALRAVA